MNQTEAQKLADLVFGETFAELRAKMKLRDKMKAVKDTAGQKQEMADEKGRSREDHA